MMLLWIKKKEKNIRENSKKHYINNKSKIKVKHDEYYENNKNKYKEFYNNNIDKKMTEEVKKLFVFVKARHEKSIFHCNYIKNN